MFEQSLMESAALARSHRGLATSISALVQLTAIAIAILLPMVFTQTLPLITSPVAERVVLPRSVPPPEPPSGNPESGRETPTSGTHTIMVNPFPAIRSLAGEHSVIDPEIPQPYSVGPSGPDNLPLSTASPSLPRGPRALVRSRLDEGRIVRRVQPEYPILAKRAGIEGRVVIEAVISRAGTIENLRVISGHTSLARAAEDAVSQWKFRPYILNGTPIEVVTQITVDFKLSRE